MLICLKTDQLIENLQDNDLLITADTIVVCNNIILNKPKDKLAWKISVLIARAMLKRNDMIEDFLQGSTHYHRKDVNPYWNRKMIRVTTIGDHIFWKDYLND